MSEQDHDEIARRLRESGTVQAPERLRGEVMDQVRAEPRTRPARRSFLMPVLPYAAAAAALVGVVAALAHFSGPASNSGSSGATAGGASGASGGGQALSPEASHDNGKRTPHVSALGAAPHEFHIAGRYLQALAPAPVDNAGSAQSYPRVVVLVVPRRLYGAYVARFRSFERHSHGDASVRVILRPVPAR